MTPSAYMNTHNSNRNGVKKIAILADFPWSFFVDGSTGRGGGQGATWLTQLAAAFSDVERYEFHWVILDRSCSVWSREIREWEGQLFHRLPAGKLSLDLLLGYFPSRRKLVRQLDEIAPDLIHCWGSERSYPVVCASSGIPSIFSVQGVLTNMERQGLLPRTWQWKLIARWEPIFLRGATIVTTESRWACERINEVVSGLDIRRVEYGVHPDFYDVVRSRDRCAPYAIFVGTIIHAKGVDTLIDAMRLLGPRDWKLKLVGEGPLLDQLSKASIPGVEFLGGLKWAALHEELAAATCLVLPTRADSSPNVVKEARVVGLPVVTTQHGGQAEYIVNGENGFVLDSLTARNLADALSCVMETPGLAERMGASRHEIDRSYFRSKRTADRFLELYDELL